MCGIAGLIGMGDQALVRDMCAQQRHRGPDDEGYYDDVASDAHLGMMRLSVIDVAGGRQPISTADGRYHIVLNGEIYNYRQLRQQLVDAGVTLRTRSDTEVVLALYQRSGAACVEQLRGMFAMAIWDSHTRELFLARDRLGVKPLYYAQCGSGFAFASELPALLRVRNIPRDLDMISTTQYLSLLYVPTPRSMLKAVHKLPAGSTMIVRHGTCTLSTYWDVASMISRQRAITVDTSVEAARAQLREAIGLRLVSDVPVGVFLSGGLDSSTIVGAMRQAGVEHIQTFSMGFTTPHDGYNELPAARRIAEYFHTDHHEFVVQPDIVTLLPDIVRKLGEPCGDSSAVLTYLLSRETRAHVKVALSGIGGDELFAGYPRHRGIHWAARYQRMPRGLRALASACARWIPDTTSSTNTSGRARRFLASGTAPIAEQYLHWTQFADAEALTTLLMTDAAIIREGLQTMPQRTMLHTVRGVDPLQLALACDVSAYLNDNLLMFGDRMSMAHGLELREPLCDTALLEYIAAVPSSTRLPRGQLKGWMKEIVRPWVPEEVLHRRKQGFMLPLGAWLRGPLRDYLQDHLTVSRLTRHGWVQPAPVMRMVEEHMSGRRVLTHQLWSILMLELWCDQVLEPACT
jgi:asparagine synthase (glutamine-hydrolysing)